MEVAAIVSKSGSALSGTMTVSRRVKTVTRHTSHVTHHTSHVTHHTSHVTRCTPAGCLSERSVALLQRFYHRQRPCAAAGCCGSPWPSLSRFLAGRTQRLRLRARREPRLMRGRQQQQQRRKRKDVFIRFCRLAFARPPAPAAATARTTPRPAAGRLQRRREARACLQVHCRCTALQRSVRGEAAVTCR